jgi:hypothetical protein
MIGNDHVRFGPGAVGKGSARGHLADGLPVSRLLAGGRFFAHENARACQDLLRPRRHPQGHP